MDAQDERETRKKEFVHRTGNTPSCDWIIEHGKLISVRVVLGKDFFSIPRNSEVAQKKCFSRYL